MSSWLSSVTNEQMFLRVSQLTRRDRIWERYRILDRRLGPAPRFGLNITVMLDVFL